MRTLRVTTGALVLFALVAGISGSALFVGTAGAQDTSSLLRCEANFAGFVIGSSDEAIHAGCEDLAPA